MTAIDFPASPTTGQQFSGPNGILYTFNGLMWVAGTAFPLGPQTFLVTLGTDVNYSTANAWIGPLQLNGIGQPGEKWLCQGGLSGLDSVGANWWYTQIADYGVVAGGRAQLRHYTAVAGLYMAPPSVVFTLTAPSNFHLEVYASNSNNWTLFEGTWLSAQRVS